MAAMEPTHLLSNGRYGVALRANGAGWSRWGRAGVTRWRDDALRDAYGTFFYLRWDRQPRPVSLTQHPAPDRGRALPRSFHADRVCFDAAWSELRGARRRSGSARRTTSSSASVVLHNLRRAHARPRADLVVRGVAGRPARRRVASGVPEPLRAAPSGRPTQQALVFERKPRLATDKGLRSRPTSSPRPSRQLIGAAGMQADRAALARPQPRRQPSARRLRRAAGRARGQRRRAARHRPRSGRRVRRCACRSRPAQGAR